MHRPHRRPSRLAAAAIAIAVLAGCSGDDGGDADEGEPGTTAPAATDPDGFTYAAARLCTDIVNGYDPAVVEAGTTANLDLLEAVVKNTPLAAPDSERTQADMGAYRDLLAAARERLGGLEPGADEASWTTVLGAVDAKIALLDTRIELLAGGDWEAVRAGVQPGGDGDVDAIEGALAELQLGGRDCEVVPGHPGNAREHAEFLAAAASTCTTVVSRRLAAGYTTDLQLAAVLDVLEEGSVTVTPELTAEADALAAEWTQTLADLAAVPTADVPDVAAWQETLDATAERVDVYTRRAAALAAADQAALAPLFTAGEVWEYPSLGDLAALGLDRRDCRSIAP